MIGTSIKKGAIALSLAFMVAAQAGAAAPAVPAVPTDPADYEFRVGRVVRLTGAVDRDSAIQVIQRLKYLDENNPGKKDITLVINSGGGDVEQGMAIYDTIRTLRSDVSTVCEGRAMSMAAVLLAAGTPGKRKALPSCHIMLHQISASNSGKMSDMMLDHHEFMKMNEALMDTVSRHTNRLKADVKKALKDDYYLNPEAAREIGVIDEVVTGRVPLPQEGARPMPL
ncbi:MAG: ATP-dependent Clp protease proteolytic subunit [Micavibrio aeruginosavorus]|uniref:ATP-dependent Clp protease proteolytic subunit n=1 Tax=Micavibrio aeruginosavorus TaxID=349221 RepID=A0A7T5R0K9_9BACT|nr:MAG: ATP-dependent Clp protease proteolytic subunit [Micavibrio aeruginosavorus]